MVRFAAGAVHERAPRSVGKQGTVFANAVDEEVATGNALWIAPEDAARFARAGLRTLDDLFAVSPTLRLDKARLPTWRERLVLELDDGEGSTKRYFVKRFCPPDGARTPRIGGGQVVRSVAGVERHWILTLGAAGLPVPRLVAFGEASDGGREVRSALVLADVGGVSLERWAAETRRAAPRELAVALAELVKRLHGHGFIHRDLYLSHVFLANGDARSPELVFIDLQRVMLRPWRWKRWVARELAQLDYSTPPHAAGPRSRLRFLKRYLGGDSLRTRRARGLLRRIARKRARIAAHDARSHARSRERSGQT